MEDLYEAARLMTKVDRQRRLMELQAKWRRLDMADFGECCTLVLIFVLFYVLQCK